MRFTDGRCCPASLDSLTLTSVDISTHGPSEPRATNERVCGLPRSDAGPLPWFPQQSQTVRRPTDLCTDLHGWDLARRTGGSKPNSFTMRTDGAVWRTNSQKYRPTYCSLATSHCCCFYIGVWDRLLVHVWGWMFSKKQIKGDCIVFKKPWKYPLLMP